MDTDTCDRDASDFRKPRFLTCGGGCGFSDCVTCHPELVWDEEEQDESGSEACR